MRCKDRANKGENLLSLEHSKNVFGLPFLIIKALQILRLIFLIFLLVFWFFFLSALDRYGRHTTSSNNKRHLVSALLVLAWSVQDYLHTNSSTTHLGFKAYFGEVLYVGPAWIPVHFSEKCTVIFKKHTKYKIAYILMIYSEY